MNVFQRQPMYFNGNQTLSTKRMRVTWSGFYTYIRWQLLGTICDPRRIMYQLHITHSWRILNIPTQTGYLRIIHYVSDPIEPWPRLKFSDKWKCIQNASEIFSTQDRFWPKKAAACVADESQMECSPYSWPRKIYLGICCNLKRRYR